jgi:hypothetical protein
MNVRVISNHHEFQTVTRLSTEQCPSSNWSSAAKCSRSRGDPFAATCELFVENPDLVEKPYRVRSRASEAHFRRFLKAIDGATTEIGMEGAI